MLNRYHQQKELDNHKDDKIRALFWYMRAGKSKVALDWLSYQYQIGNVNFALVIAPNGVHDNWRLEEIPKWVKYPHDVMSFTQVISKRKKYQLELNNRILNGNNKLKILTVSHPT